MAKKHGGIICTNECAECVHSDLDKNNIKMDFYCDARAKHYIYGQYVPCEMKELRKDE